MLIQNREVFFTLIPVFNLVVLALMLWAEIKARGFPNKTVRPLIIISLMVMQLLMLILFGFLQKSARIFTLTLIQGTIGMIYLEVGWYFLKKSSRVLNNKKRWYQVLKRVMIAMIIIFVATEIYCIVDVIKKHVTQLTICHGLTDVLMQSYCSLAVGCFCVLTYFISARIHEQTDKNKDLVMAT